MAFVSVTQRIDTSTSMGPGSCRCRSTVSRTARDLGRLQQRSPHPPLPLPIQRRGDRPDHVLADRVAAALRRGQAEKRLLDVGREAQQAHYLADAGSGAEAREWRSAPLWGLGRAGPDGTTYLHDGRARNLIEAILWHGGEARAARKRVRALAKEDRAALIAFLKSL